VSATSPRTPNGRLILAAQAVPAVGLDVEDDDHRVLERASFVYDALFAWCRQEVTQP
jgi:hypothetical protein